MSRSVTNLVICTQERRKMGEMVAVAIIGGIGGAALITIMIVTG